MDAILAEQESIKQAGGEPLDDGEVIGIIQDVFMGAFPSRMASAKRRKTYCFFTLHLNSWMANIIGHDDLVFPLHDIASGGASKMLPRN